MVIFLECYSSMNYYQFIVNIPFLVALISWVIFWKSFAQMEILDIFVLQENRMTPNTEVMIKYAEYLRVNIARLNEELHDLR